MNVIGTLFCLMWLVTKRKLHVFGARFIGTFLCHWMLTTIPKPIRPWITN
nr:MAG TPA: hypothetical protein [Caudoviricetes sp.]